MPISKSRYNRLLDECEKHGFEVNRDRLPLPGKSYIGRELEFETEFLDELIGDNSDHGFYLGSTHDNANPEEDLYLNILGDMLKVCGFSREQVEGGNSVDDAGNSTIRLEIDGQEFGWRANITEEYIDTEVIDSMVETLNRYTDKQLYVSNYGDELYCVLACPGKVAQLISEIYVDDEDLEEEAVGSVDAKQQKEISFDDFYGERRGSELSDEGIAAGEAAIASIDSNDLAAFEASLEPIGHFVCACEIVDHIFDHLVLPEGLDKPGGPPDRPHTESCF